MNAPGTVARCELDTHADTCVAGPNFQLNEYTGDFCDVTPYSTDYQPLTNIPIVNASTAFTDDTTGETVIFRFNQVLWYGSRLEMSLINPNQIRYSGIVVSDDPTDKTRNFGITGDGFHIPFTMQGTTVYFDSRVPTVWEYEHCRIIELTADTPWNPGEVNISAVASNNLSMEQVTYRNVCAMERIPRCESCEERCNCGSDLSAFEPAPFIQRMVSAVKVATANRNSETVQLAFVGAKDRHSQVSAETIARKFRCGLETAQRTLKTTTQRGVRHAIHPLHRRYRVDHLNLHRRRLHDTFYMDTLFSKVKSISGYTCAQLITNGSFTRVYPMESKASTNIATVLQEFIDDVGIPETLVCDFASEQTGKNTEVMRIVRQSNVKLRIAEKGRGITQNHRAETEIREIKTKWKTRMRSNQVPARLWDYGLVYISEIQSILARGVDKRPGLEKLTGETIDISEWLDFDFYDRVWYWDQKKTDMTEEQAKIGRWLGIAHRIGSDMTYWVLTESGKVIARSTVQHITTTDMAADAMKARVATFDERLLTRLDDENFQLALPNHVLYLQDDDVPDDPSLQAIPPDAEYGDMLQASKPDADEIEFDTFDQYLGAEFLVNSNGENSNGNCVQAC
jgi:hypothetical protein